MAGESLSTALSSITPDQTRLGNTPDASANRQGGAEFNRQEWHTFQPALTVMKVCGWPWSTFLRRSACA